MSAPQERLTPSPVTLGHGHDAVWIWREGMSKVVGIPLGVLIRHGDGRVFVPWAKGDHEQCFTWNLDSLVPLTITPGVVCPRCGLGEITDGRWEPK